MGGCEEGVNTRYFLTQAFEYVIVDLHLSKMSSLSASVAISKQVWHNINDNY